MRDDPRDEFLRGEAGSGRVGQEPRDKLAQPAFVLVWRDGNEVLIQMQRES